MAIVKPDNSAGRLYLVLEEMKKTRTNDVPTYQVLATYLGVESTNSVEISFGLLGIINLINTTKEDIRTLNIDDDQKELYEKPLREIESVFLIGSLHAPWKNHIERIAKAKEQLQYSAMYLSNNGRTETVASNPDLEALLQSVEELLDEVGANCEDMEFGQLIIDKLIAIKRAIKLYPILGAQGLIEALELALGMAIIYHTVINSEDEQKQKFSAKFAKIIEKGMGIALAATAKVLAENAISGIPLLLSKLP